MRSIRRVTFFIRRLLSSELLPLGFVLKDPIVVIPFFEFPGCFLVDDHLAIGVQLHGRGADHGGDGSFNRLGEDGCLGAPVANNSSSRESKMVPTPIVSARFGTLSGSPPNIAAFCWRVMGVSAFSRVRDMSAERGSLKPIWPASPMPKSCTSMPPTSRIRCS